MMNLHFIAGNYNKDIKDKTKWYALTKMGEFLLNGTEIYQLESNITSENNSFQNETSIAQNEQYIVQDDNIHCPECAMEITKMNNGFTQNEQPIPVINTVNNLTVSNDTVCRTDIQYVAEHWNQLAAYGIKPVIIGYTRQKVIVIRQIFTKDESNFYDKYINSSGTVMELKSCRNKKMLQK